jgi:hypothetical protein
MSPLETEPALPGQPAPAEGTLAAPYFAGERATSGPDASWNSPTPAPAPSFLAGLLRALSAWGT